METKDMAAEALEEAADNLLMNGWRRRSLGKRGESQCAAGHVNTGMENVLGCKRDLLYQDAALYAKYSMAIELAYDALYSILGIDRRNNWGIADWNDMEAKDEWEVRDAFLTAAKKIRGGE